MIEVAVDSPLGNALSEAVRPKLLELGWAPDPNDNQLLELVLLMIASGKTEEELVGELGRDILSLPTDDPTLRAFSNWLYEQIEVLHAQLNGAGAAQEADPTGEMDTDMATTESSELNAPTGPRSMRNGGPRGGREKRMMGHITKAMDRNDNVLHRVRGQTGSERINTHNRGGTPTGPRGGANSRFNRNNNNRAASIQHGLQGMAAGMQGMGSPQSAGWMMQGQQPNQMDMMAMMEQQNQMIYQLSQQIMNSGGNNSNFNGQNRRGKPLSDRVQNKGNFRKGHHNSRPNIGETPAEGEDVDMSGEKREPPNPEDTVCKYNLACTNKDCKFAHQSPAAPPGANVDVNDVCSFGAACKNRKCTGRHPSPAQKMAHQSEQDCKFWPNCTNQWCPFKHPSMPLCRNGANCTTPDCKFTHVKTKCKFNPCTNRTCRFAHEEGQQGGFKDKVWTADGGSHVSDRKFVDENADEELVQPDVDLDVVQAQRQGSHDVDVIV